MKPTWEGFLNPRTSGLTSLVVDMQGATLVHPGDHLVLGAVEAVHADHTGLLLGVGVVRVGGVQVVLEHGQAIQVLDLGRQAWVVNEMKGMFAMPNRQAVASTQTPASALPSSPSRFI